MDELKGKNVRAIIYYENDKYLNIVNNFKENFESEGIKVIIEHDEISDPNLMMNIKYEIDDD